MKKYITFLIVLLGVVISAFSQTRQDITIFVAPVYVAPVVGHPEFASFFQENFTIETKGAGYAVADNESDADYNLELEVKPNMIQYDDGTEEAAPPDEKQYILQVTLIRNEDKNEIVTFTFAFDTTDEMYDFNLYLLYEAMATVPITKLDGIPDDDTWRNKRLYIRASFDYPITFYQLMKPDTIYGVNAENVPDKWYKLDHKISPFPAVTFGIEFQYLNWMSTEANFFLSFSDPFSVSLIPAIQIEQKFPIKPGRNFMIEPYAAVSFPFNTSPISLQFPKVGLGGGVQVGVKGGRMGAFFVDINYIHFLGDVVMKNNSSYYPYPAQINYMRFAVGIGIGYKIGFFDRPTS